MQNDENVRYYSEGMIFTKSCKLTSETRCVHPRLQNIIFFRLNFDQNLRFWLWGEPSAYTLVGTLYFFYYRLEVEVCIPSWDELGHQKTPEMSELEADKYSVKIWAHNFEKQKS